MDLAKLAPEQTRQSQYQYVQIVQVLALDHRIPSMRYKLYGQQQSDTMIWPVLIQASLV
jgi:hypothetical protein